MNKEDFLNPRASYHGSFSPEKLAFNANLQEISTKIGYIVGLETSGKLDSATAYDKIKALYKELKRSKKNLLTKDSAA